MYLSPVNYITLNALRYLFLVLVPQKTSFLSSMPDQPGVTGTESRHGELHSRVADDSRRWWAPDTTTLTTPRSPKPPVHRTTGNYVTDANVTPDDPEFAHKVWEYIRSQLLRLQGTNVQ